MFKLFSVDGPGYQVSSWITCPINNIFKVQYLEKTLVEGKVNPAYHSASIFSALWQIFYPKFDPMACHGCIFLIYNELTELEQKLTVETNFILDSATGPSGVARFSQ